MFQSTYKNKYISTFFVNNQRGQTPSVFFFLIPIQQDNLLYIIYIKMDINVGFYLNQVIVHIQKVFKPPKKLNIRQKS